MVVILLFLLSTLYAVNDENTFNCSKLTNSGLGPCQDTIYCTWITTPPTCVNDPCLKFVADSELVATACDDVKTINPVFDCKLFYLTDKYDCSNGEPIQSDRYCRSNSTAYQKAPMSGCFYNDLKSLASGETGICPAPLCVSNTTSGGGKYCAQSGADVCNTAYNTPDGPLTAPFCDCLGVAGYCDLYPGCQIVSSKCVADPCYAYSATSAGCDSVLSTLAPSCGQQIVNTPSNNAGITTYKCVNKTRTLVVNTCFDLQNITVTSGSYEGCDKVDENPDVCGTGRVYDKNNANTNENCKWVDIAGGFFSAAPQHYCSDGKRNVPSPTGSGFVFKIPSVLILIAATFLLML